MHADGDGGQELPSTLPSARQFAEEVKRVASATAAAMQRRFARMATIIIATHIIATILAAAALGFAPFHWAVIPALLGLELVMLVGGLAVHWRLHHSRISRRRAEARLLAEVARSALAIGDLHLHLEYLFALPFPMGARPLLRTLNVLHLRSTRHEQTAWQVKREQYVSRRLTAEDVGQIAFYGRKAADSTTRLQRLRTLFYVFWVPAFVATLVKLVHHQEKVQLLTAVLGTLSIVLPVLRGRARVGAICSSRNLKSPSPPPPAAASALLPFGSSAPAASASGSNAHPSETRSSMRSPGSRSRAPIRADPRPRSPPNRSSASHPCGD
jgi:hypothetical protein